MTVRVQVMSRPGCHLCEVAVAVVDQVCADVDADWVERDIMQNAEQADRYSDRVPVVLVDGVEVAQFRVDSARLRRALAGG